MVELRTGSVGGYFGTRESESEPLNESQMQANSVYIFRYLHARGWSIQAIAGILGNMEAESTINPGRWQSDDVLNMSLGYGLVQWTPSTKYIDWCGENGIADFSAMDSNLERILYEVENNIQWIATDRYNFSFKEFSVRQTNVQDLAKAFLLNYERPADQSESVQNYRADNASKWLNYLSDYIDEEIITPENYKKRKFNFVLFRKRRIYY